MATKDQMLEREVNQYCQKNSSVDLSRYSIFIVLRVQRIHLTIHVFFPFLYFSSAVDNGGGSFAILGNLKKLTGSEQLPYLAYVTAFLQTSLFLDTF